MPQVCQYARGRRNDQRRRGALSHHILQSGGHPLSKTILLDFMPVRRLDSAVADCVGAREGATGAIGSLFVGWGIVIDENALGQQIGKLFVAFVAQKKRLAAVADENESVMRNSELAHITLQKNDATFTIHAIAGRRLGCIALSQTAKPMRPFCCVGFNEPSR